MVHADTIGAVSRAFSLRRDQLLGRLWQFVDLWARGLRSPANIPGAEYELLHREVVGGWGEIFPWLDERISEHGVLHQPKAEGQSQLAAGAGRNLAVHDHDAPARAQLFQGVAQHHEMMRHSVVGKAEQHAVERLRGDIFGGVIPRQLDVAPW